MPLADRTHQTIADLIADELVLQQMEALVSSLNLSLTPADYPTRQSAAETLVEQAVEQDSLGDIILFLEKEGLWRTGTLNVDAHDQEETRETAPRLVNTGFADPLNPERPIRKNIELYPDSDYLFWVQIGAQVKGAIDIDPAEIDVSSVPADGQLTVVLFSFPDELQLVDGQDVGKLQFLADGSIGVSRSPLTPNDLSEETKQHRLFFPLSTPADPGIYKLRCHIYYEQLLLQSHLVTAEVAIDPKLSPDIRLSTKVDYTVSNKLGDEQLKSLPPYKMSIMLNDNGEGSHGFRFWGEGEFKNEVAVDGQTLQNLVDQARGAMRKVAWGTEDPFDPARDAYRYDAPLDPNKLKIDLLRLAIRGYRIYDVLINQIAGGGRAAETLADTMRRPGFIQLANKESARLVVPLSMMYDHPLYTSLKASEFSLCETFLQALTNGTPLHECDCFQGDCPSYGEDDIVCPSGFWGFRHALGHPITVEYGPEAVTSFPQGSPLELAMAVSTDPNFIGREAHEASVQAIADITKFHYANERPETIDLLKTTNPHLFYFFCHGRISADVPSIEVGPPGTRGISRDVLRAKRIRWDENIRPIVFINGCNTAALSPDKAFDLVTGFVSQSEAAGVIGTEITNFVPMAKQFAEQFFDTFLVQKQPVGEAVRLGRLALLQSGNPLGLIYIPFVVPSLQISGN